MKYILVFAVIFLAAFPARAHSPYLIKEKIIKDSYGNAFILEKAYGDGIFSADPASLQLRNPFGVVLAYSPTSQHVASFCPSLYFCWAFLYNSGSIFAAGYKLNPSIIDWNAIPEKLDLKKEEKEAFEKYLADPKYKSSRNYGSGYPEDRKDYKGFSPSKISTLFSPIFIILNHIIPFLVSGGLPAFLIYLYWLFFERWVPKDKTKKILLRSFGGLIILVGITIYLLILVIIGFTLGTPFVYVITAMIAAVTAPYTTSGTEPT